MKKINKFEDFIKNQYDNYDEDARFTESKGKRVEYLTNMRYIHKFLKKGMKVLEVGAGTGAYSVALAKEGFDITAIELVESNLNVLRENAKGVKIRAEQGDALDLSRFEDNTFDVVLNLGPMYHLFTKKDKLRAISESIRVCKKGGTVMFAFLTHSSTVWAYGIKKKHIVELSKELDKDGRVKDIPEEIFSSFFVDEFKELTNKFNIKNITTVASDGLAYTFREFIEELNDEEYELFLKWHFSTCERKDQLGLSSHILDIYKKE